ncbi:hypothetical protein KKC16_01435 [Patescibacteria group bacterium]|nr:hypothetical protein [Patescibacteria group bacterium]MBU4482097.1 hypothetical protein [Patescibacteria group bacterium]
MTLSKYLILMILATLFCWTAFLIVVYSVNPLQTVFLGFVLFYVSLFFSVTGLAAIIGFLVRYFFNKNQFIGQQVKIAFRQGIWFGVLIIVSLFLQSQGLIAWWNLLILLIILASLEMMFLKNNNYATKT